MKKLLFVLASLFLFVACTPSIPTASNHKGDNVIDLKGDDEEYELIIIDPGYDSWAVSYAKPINFYSPSYYENWNNIYVQAWNEKVSQVARYRAADFPFENYIDYNPAIDYGVELNYKLYTYFQYIESIYGRRYNFPGNRFRG